MKNILILGGLIIIVLGLILVLAKPKEISAPNSTTDAPTVRSNSEPTTVTTNSTTTITTQTNVPLDTLKTGTTTAN